MDIIKRYEGDFWIPEAPDRKIAGECLVYTGGRIELRLHGMIESPLNSLDFTDQQTYPRLIGHTGSHVLTLDGCTPTNGTKGSIGNTGYGPLIRTTMLVRCFYHDLEMIGDDVPRFGGASIEIVDLLQFARLQVISERRFLNKEKPGFDRLEITAEGSTTGPERFQDGTIEIQGLYSWSVSSNGERTFRPYGTVVINFDSPRDATAITRYATRLRDVVALAIGRPSDIASITLFTDEATIDLGGNERPRPIAYYWDHRRPTLPPASSRSHELLFDLPSIGGVGALGRLLTVLERQEFANARIMNTVHHPSPFLEEKASRRLLPLQSLFDKYSWEKPDWPKDLKHKLAALAGIAGKPMTDLLGGYTESWAKAAKAARDLEGHGDLDKDGHQYGNLRLHADVALWLYTMVVLREANVPETAFTALAASSRYEQLRRRLERHMWIIAEIEIDAAVFARLHGGTATVHVDRARAEYQNLAVGDALCFRHQGQSHFARVTGHVREVPEAELSSEATKADLGPLHGEVVAAANLLGSVQKLKVIPIAPI